MSALPRDRFSVLVHLIFREWRGWMKNEAALSELSRLDPVEFDDVARDVGLSGTELRVFAGKWPNSAALLSRRIAALGFDERQLGDKHTQVFRDLQRVCGLCDEQKRCERELDRQVKSGSWQRYCSNTSTLASLVTQRDGVSDGTARPTDDKPDCCGSTDRKEG